MGGSHQQVKRQIPKNWVVEEGEIKKQKENLGAPSSVFPDHVCNLVLIRWAS